MGQPHIVVHQQEFFQLRLIKGLRRAYRALCKPRGLGRGIGVECCPLDVSATWPEPRADYFVRVGFACDEIRSARSGARRPEKRVTARSKLPQKKCTGLALPRKPVRNCLNTRSTFTRIWKKRRTASGS